MASAKPTGYVRTIERKDGPVFYAKLKLPDAEAAVGHSVPSAGHRTFVETRNLLADVTSSWSATSPQPRASWSSSG
jgi:hypothetical protein